MEIRISEKEILSGDISKIKTIIDKFAPDRRLSAENENKISIEFDQRSYDLIKKIHKNDLYKAWFQKLDSEYTYLPFFLNKESKTLMFFIMGNTRFEIDSQNNVQFDEVSKERYIKKKRSAIVNFCVNHNIDPHSAVHRLASFKPENSIEAKARQLIKIAEYLDKYSSIAALNMQSEFVVWLRLAAHPSDLKILQCHYVKDCPQPCFSIILENAGYCLEYSVKILASGKDIESFLEKNSSIKIVVVFKENNENQSIPIETHFTCITRQELEEERKKIKNAPEKPEKQPEDTEKTLPLREVAEETPAETPEKTEEKTEEKIEERTEEKAEAEVEKEVEEEETAPANETPEETISRLKKENRELKAKLKQKDKLIEEYEEAINRLQQHPIASFFKKLFK